MLATAKTFNERLPSVSAMLANYGEIHRKLSLLIDLDAMEADAWESRSHREPHLYCLVLERHPYTTLLRLTHLFPGRNADALMPDAHVRVYHDARVAEVTHCFPGVQQRTWYQPQRESRLPGWVRWKMNRFFEQWLDHLLNDGHSGQTFQPCLAPAVLERLEALPPLAERQAADQPTTRR